MTILVEDPRDEDYPALVSLVFEAYGGKNEYINAVFPKNTTETGLENAVLRCVFTTKMSKAVKWHKVTDGTTGEIIGGAMWSIYTDAKPPNSELDGPPGTWENEDEKEYAQALFRGCKEYERKYWDENDLPLVSMSS
ncbi:hypothetical protein BU26DRAFT_532980 [Trematosphaeria pertusa]|uniref:N-acetyltransferase domain-containing protein n=1 Tax=Trematosphaeria pertusa TaxID=390896 RepID=A0A6A6I543_9PLEO|nr:uncharacterized protein BU26DRAFT_532980 [Trematosphaeria pertusa]KAF2245446.1 hypothetical protein BU26DRAFT_532980 [Trematosphaeria pertusa]